MAELGNGNQPLDMVVYQKDGKTFVLMANTKHGLIKVDTTGIDSVEPITAPVARRQGRPEVRIDQGSGQRGAARPLERQHGAVLVKNGTSFDLKSIGLP